MSREVVNMETFFKAVASVSGGVLVYIFGTWHELFGVFIALWFFDVITGLVAAGKNGKISSIRGLIGIAKKVLIFSLIATSHIADMVLDTGDVIRNSTLMWFVVNEMISIIENAMRAGVPVPPKLKEAIDLLKEKKRG
jgi:toxin secretion/phage lysis holin